MKNRETLELVIFDMDGLIFNTEKLSYECWKSAADKIGIDFDMNIFCKLLGTNSESVRKTLIKEYKDEKIASNFIQFRNEEYRDIVASGTRVEKKKGIDKLLSYLSDNKIKKAVATSSNREIAYKLLKDANIFDYFDCVLCGDEIKKSKPDPEVFLNVAKKLNINPKNTMVLEDSEAGILAAYRAEMIPIIIPDMKEPNEETMSRVYKKVESLDKVIELI